MTRIRETAAFLPPRVSTAQIVGDSLNAYLAEKDASSGYLTREEYRDFQRLQDDSYVGIGMEIEKDAEGNVLCFPVPGSVPAKAGIRARDRLKSIEGVAVAGKSLLALGSLARGAPGSRLALVIVTPAGIERQVILTRAMTSIETVSQRKLGSIPVIRIRAFTRGTKGKLAALAADWARDRPAILDLRANRGGDLHAAIDAAQLFLPAGARIVSVTGRSTKHYRSDNAPLNMETPIYLWQDEATA
ncbi:MAG: S41 family peptidase, partial [Gammaproteobacteria bacterium]